ncbi:AAA domain-containing protein [Mycena amicta]|nr:AAA domain-containing protein [Mycena amicta]
MCLTLSNGNFQNIEESKTILAQAKEYQKRGRSYRILTPYDAQRGLIERGLREADLLWHNKVFCVDSFQGNEDDYILISIVRTEKIGFLSDARRVNVMLSRCKRGLVVCANRAFIENQAGDTLVRGSWRRRVMDGILVPSVN